MSAVIKVTALGNYQAANQPRYVSLLTTDSYAQITVPGYIDKNMQDPVLPGDFIFANYGANSALQAIFQVTGVLGSLTATPLLGQTYWVDSVLTAAQLATAGKVNAQPSSGLQQYTVRNIFVNKSTGLSGGGGDRLLALTDGTSVYNNAGITAALLGTPINTVWGGSGNPLPGGSVSIQTATVAGANLYWQYSGGTTDFSTGSVAVSVQLQRVA